MSFSGTSRDGFILNTVNSEKTNTLNNGGIRGQLLFAASQNVVVVGAVDHTRQRPNGYAQVVVGVAPTLRPANRQYAQIAADLNYAPPSFNAFDRLTDTDTPWQSNQDLGGSSVTVEWKVGRGQLTSTTAWRYWDWIPRTTGTSSACRSPPSPRRPQAETVDAGSSLRGTVLAEGWTLSAGRLRSIKKLDSNPSFKQEQGSAAARFLLGAVGSRGDARVRWTATASISS